MSFGKKNTVHSQSYPAAGRGDAGTEQEAGSPLLRQLSRFGVKIVVCVVGAILLVVMLNYMSTPSAIQPRYAWLSPALDAAEAVFEAAGAESKALAAKCPIPRFESRTLHVDLRRASWAAAREAIEKAAKVRMAVHEGAYVSEVGEHVACVITYKPERYCQSGQRAALVAYAHRYLGMREKARVLLRETMDFSEAQLNGYIRFSAKKLDQQTGMQTTEHMVAVKGYGELGALNPKFEAALKFLIEDGYLSVGDVSVFLGMVTPAPLKPIFASTDVRTRECERQ